MQRPYFLHRTAPDRGVDRIGSGIILLAILLIAISASFPLQGQIVPSSQSSTESSRHYTRLLGGVSLGGNLNSYTAGIPMVYTPICNHLEEGEGLGYRLGISLEYLLTSALSLSVEGAYASHPGQFERVDAIGSTRNTPTGETGSVIARILSDVDYQTAEFSTLFRWKGGRFSADNGTAGFAIGPFLSLPLITTMSQEHHLEVYSESGEYLTERLVRTVSGAELDARTLADHEEMTRARDLQYGLRMGAFIEYEFARGVYITPGLFLDAPMTSMTDFNWGSLSAYTLQVDMKVGL